MVTQQPIVSAQDAQAIITRIFGDGFGNHPGCEVKETRTAGGELIRIDINFTRCWTYEEGIFKSRFGHIPDATCNYDWMGVSLRENRHSFVQSVEIVCDSSDGRYKIRLAHYWRPVHSFWGLLGAHFRGPWYAILWRIVTVLGVDFRTGLCSDTMSMGPHDNHLAAFEAVRVPKIETMPHELREMLTS